MPRVRQTHGLMLSQGEGPGMHRIIDWNELWKATHVCSPERTRKDRDPAAVWDKRAGAYLRATRDGTRATGQELGILNLREGDTVLDVGAGTGRLAVPIAQKVAKVTAVDPSGGMLGLLEKHMREKGRGNYSIVQMRWEDVVIGKDIDVHDVAIAAFSLGFYDLGAALQKLDSAARRSVYLFWHAGEWRSREEMELYRRVFGEEAAMQRGYPDYIYPVNILHDAGIYPNVRIYHGIWDTGYESVEEAVNTWVAMHDPGREDVAPIREYFTRVLRRNTSGTYVETSVRPSAAIWWEKDA